MNRSDRKDRGGFCVLFRRVLTQRRGKEGRGKENCIFFKLGVDKLRRIGYNNKAFCGSAK